LTVVDHIFKLDKVFYIQFILSKRLQNSFKTVKKQLQNIWETVALGNRKGKPGG
jgi:hypothetical protein